MSIQYDVIINGGGMVGAITALLLSRHDLTVAVIEAQGQTTYSHEAQRTLRVSAISQHNLGLFKSLGLIDLMQNSRMGYYNYMYVWDNHSTGEIDFESPSNQPLGAMVENNQIIAAAQQLMLEQANIDVHFATSIQSFEQSERKVRVQLDNGDEVQSYLLIGADGAGSQVRSAVGIDIDQKSYQQQGLVAYIKFENAPEHTALQAFNQGGPVGLLPMNNGLFSMVWSLPESEVTQWLACDERKFINGLKAHINRNFGEVQLQSDRVAFPLQKTYAADYYKNRTVLVGDAAHTIHPLAGQGVNLGFGDAERLVNSLIGVKLKDNSGLTNALKKYQRASKAEAHKTAETMHALHHLFTSESAPIKMLRAFGMNRLNQINPLKTWFLRQAGS